MKNRLIQLIFCSLGFLIGTSRPAISEQACPPTAEPNQTIEHLIKYVADSRLTFIRNGDAVDSKAASDHIRSKYDHFRSKIHSAEEFISQCATRSLFSGKAYLVRLSDGTEKQVSEWLAEELTRYRKNGCPN